MLDSLATTAAWLGARQLQPPHHQQQQRWTALSAAQKADIRQRLEELTRLTRVLPPEGECNQRQQQQGQPKHSRAQVTRGSDWCPGLTRVLPSAVVPAGVAPGQEEYTLAKQRYGMVVGL